MGFLKALFCGPSTKAECDARIAYLKGQIASLRAQIAQKRGLKKVAGVRDGINACYREIASCQAKIARLKAKRKQLKD